MGYVVEVAVVEVVVVARGIIIQTKDKGWLSESFFISFDFSFLRLIMAVATAHLKSQ